MAALPRMIPDIRLTLKKPDMRVSLENRRVGCLVVCFAELIGGT
jgi:hypothetical protein